MSQENSFRVAADVGGTFTDVVVVDASGRAWTRKVPSTPPDFERGVIEAVDEMLRKAGLDGDGATIVSHGTTVATNAVLERRGARTALVTTRGFRDVLELRRVRAPQIYDLFFEKPAVIIDRYLRLELGERVSAEGETLAAVDESELEQICEKLRSQGVESVAVCLLHSYAFPQHEEIVGRRLRERLPEVPVSLSSEVLRQRREYERTATTAVNAYVRPVMESYLQRMRRGFASLDIEAPILIMQSAGGLTSAADAAVRPVFVLESGPAAGVLASGHVAGQLGTGNVISFDMGGTTAKASLIEEGRISYSAEYEVGASVSAGNRLTGGGGELILAPSIDIAEVGAGGGSIAYLDRAGGLRVGPESAGAVPGPACYGTGGTEPTVTDANVVLGYIRGGRLAGGDVAIDAEAAHRAVHDKLAEPLGMDVLAAARGVHAIANARMMRALREVSTQRGRDPREFVLMAFGGSGPVHAAGLARELGPRRIIVPPMPGLFSAVGLLVSGVEHHDVRSCQLAGEALIPEAIEELLQEMRAVMTAQFRAESYGEEELSFSGGVDMRFLGQASQIRVAAPGGSIDAAALARMRAEFEDEHERLYGHRAEPGAPVQVVAVRLVGRAETGGGGIRAPSGEGVSPGSRRATFDEPWGNIDTPVVARASLAERTDGPLLVDEYDATIVVPPDAVAWCDENGNLLMEFADGQR